MIGLDFTDHDLCIAELETPGLVYSPGKQHWVERWNERFKCTPENHPDETGARLTELFGARNCRATRARLALRPQAARIVQADLPEGDVRVREWIEDHAETLLQLPVSARDIVFDYRPVADADGAHRIEIAFVRRAEIERSLSVCRSAGLQAVSIGAGRIEGEPDLGEFQFLPADIRETGETQLWRSLLQRTALACGGLLLTLLLLQSVAAFYVETRKTAIDEASQAMEATAREVAMRASAVQTLEERVATMRVGTHRSQVAHTLHDLAASVTPGVRFQALEVQAPERGKENFAVSGEVVTHARLAVYLASLDTARFCSGVQLLQSGREKGAWPEEKPAAPGAVGFMVQGGVR